MLRMTTNAITSRSRGVSDAQQARSTCVSDSSRSAVTRAVD
jgi:hypothetical protein